MINTGRIRASASYLAFQHPASYRLRLFEMSASGPQRLQAIYSDILQGMSLRKVVNSVKAATTSWSHQSPTLRYIMTAFVVHFQSPALRVLCYILATSSL